MKDEYKFLLFIIIPTIVVIGILVLIVNVFDLNNELNEEPQKQNVLVKHKVPFEGIEFDLEQPQEGYTVFENNKYIRVDDSETTEDKYNYDPNTKIISIGDYTKRKILYYDDECYIYQSLGDKKYIDFERVNYNVEKRDVTEYVKIYGKDLVFDKYGDTKYEGKLKLNLDDKTYKTTEDETENKYELEMIFDEIYINNKYYLFELKLYDDNSVKDTIYISSDLKYAYLKDKRNEFDYYQ